MAHSDVGVLKNYVWFGVVQKVAPVPPSSGCSLQMANYKGMHPMIPFGVLEHRQMAEIVLQPTGLGLCCGQKDSTEKIYRPTSPKVEHYQVGHHF